MPVGELSGGLTGRRTATTIDLVGCLRRRFGCDDTATITGTWNAAKGILTLSGSDTPVAYQAAIRTIGFQDTATIPALGARKISFTVTDGVATSKAFTRSIMVAKSRPADPGKSDRLLAALAALRPAQSSQKARQTLFASVQNWAVDESH